MSLSLHYGFRGGPEVSIRFPAATTNILLGNGSEPVDVSLTGDVAIPPKQAQLKYWLGTWWVENLDDMRPLCLDGRKLTGEAELRSGDLLSVGSYILRVEFELPISKIVEEPGVLSRRFESVESQPPNLCAPDDQIRVLVRVTDVAATARTRQSLLEGFLRELTDSFPTATRQSILLIEDQELVVRASSPELSTVSFTLAREVIRSRQAFAWQRYPSAVRDLTELDTQSALYAPMLCGGLVLGVAYVASHLEESVFTERDLKLLSVMANTMGPALAASDKSVPRLPQVFVSYSRADLTFINRLAGDLRRRQVKVWYDERLQTGETWRRQLTSAIRRTDSFIIVLSPRSVESEIVQWELATAQKARKTVIPLLYETCKIPTVIRPLQYRTVSGTDAERELVLDKLVEQLGRLR